MSNTVDFYHIKDNKKKEEEYVHEVYNQISNHFSKTRYKPWPIVANFLKTRKDYTIGIDVGCGNGKYLQLNKKLFILGSDRSDGLISCANTLMKEKEKTKDETLSEQELEDGFSSMCFGEKRCDVMVNDGLSLPYPDNRFDFAISIAVIHHFSSEERRIEAIKHIGSKLVKGGEALIYVWALEQKDSRRGYNDSMEQDILVPWVLEGEFKETKSEEETKNNNKNVPKEGKKAIKERSKPDLSNVPKEKRSEVIRIWKEEQAEKRRLKAEKEARELEEKKKKEEEIKLKNTKYRYYHMYKSGELEENILRTEIFEIVNSGYERDNWWCICRKL
ncbi:hypothetical protein ACO0SA_000455 [Hanseniaspora valbyensis]